MRVPFRWITGDEGYGDDRRLRVWREQNTRAYVLVISANPHLWPDMSRQQ